MARTRILALGIAVAGLAAASCSEKPKPVAAATTPPSAPAAPTITVASKSCIDIQRIQESRVRSDSVIDFHMIDRTIYRSTLPNSCPQLGFERAFTYATSLSQLCSTDIITVIIQGGGPSRGASCGLGQFTPISPELAKASVN